jgi:hypothetical protein
MNHDLAVRASTNIDRVRAFTRQDQHLTIRMITDELNINESTVHHVVKKVLNMRKVCAKMVRKNLNDDKKAYQNEMWAEMLE